MGAGLEVVKPRQSNYDTYFLPKEVKDIGKDTPLYRLVSFWIMRKSDFVCRDDIASAFGISLRQASGLISAICRKDKEIQFSLRRIKASKGNVVKSYIQIQRVFERPKRAKSPSKISNLPRKVKEKQAQAKGKLLWMQLISRGAMA